jgi:hypothetical protein
LRSNLWLTASNTAVSSWDGLPFVKRITHKVD